MKLLIETFNLGSLRPGWKCDPSPRQSKPCVTVWGKIKKKTCHKSQHKISSLRKICITKKKKASQSPHILAFSFPLPLPSLFTSYLLHPSFFKFQVTTPYSPHYSPLSSHTSASLSMGHSDKGTSMSTPTVWQQIIMSGHRVGQRGEVRGQATVTIKGVSAVNSFVYIRKRPSFPINAHITMSCHAVNVGMLTSFRTFDGDGIMMIEMKNSADTV